MKISNKFLIYIFIGVIAVLYLFQFGFSIQSKYELVQKDDRLDVQISGLSTKRQYIIFSNAIGGIPPYSVKIFLKKNGRLTKIATVKSLYLVNQDTGQKINLQNKDYIFRNSGTKNFAFISPNIQLNESDYILYFQVDVCDRGECSILNKEVKLKFSKSKRFISFTLFRMMSV